MMKALKTYWKLGVATAALYAANLGVGIAEPVQYVETQDNAPITQAVKEAQVAKIHQSEVLNSEKLAQVLRQVGSVDGVTGVLINTPKEKVLRHTAHGVKQFKGRQANDDERQIQDAIDLLASTKIGSSVLAKLPNNVDFAMMDGMAGHDQAGGMYVLNLKSIFMNPDQTDFYSFVSTLLHEMEHAVQSDLGVDTLIKQGATNDTMHFGNLLLEADSLATTCLLWRERPDIATSGMDEIANVFNQIWDKNYQISQDEETANIQTKKDFIKMMIASENGIQVADGIKMHPRFDKFISAWHKMYRDQTNQLAEQFDSTDQVGDQNKLITQLGESFGFSAEETQEMYQALAGGKTVVQTSVKTGGGMLASLAKGAENGQVQLAGKLGPNPISVGTLKSTGR